jgi:hypothetical protein
MAQDEKHVNDWSSTPGLCATGHMSDEGDEMGMFAWDDWQTIDTDVHEYTDCTFQVDVKGVAKKGETATSITVDHSEKTMDVHKDKKVYTMKIGYYCYDMTVKDDWIEPERTRGT